MRGPGGPSSILKNKNKPIQLNSRLSIEIDNVISNSGLLVQIETA